MAEMTTFNMNSIEYSLILWLKALKCGWVYDEAMFKDAFIENLHVSIRYSIHACWGGHTMGKLHDLTRPATVFTSLQSGLASPAISASWTQTQKCFERRRGRSDQNVMVTVSSAMQNMNSSPTNTDRAMAINNDNKATSLRSTPNRTTRTTPHRRTWAMAATLASTPIIVGRRAWYCPRIYARSGWQTSFKR